MIIAGAGSGKTRVLTFRLAHLIATGQAKAYELLALTFTNKAAKEMRNRIYQLIGHDARHLTMGTFHSVFSRVLRAEAERIGFTQNFTIYDTQDSQSLIKRIIIELGKDDKKFKPRNMMGRISLAKNQLITPEAYENYIEDEQSEVAFRVYKIYRQRCLQANAMDFDDLLFNMAHLLSNFPDMLSKYQKRWKFLMVDEYQDTNHAQYVITKKLAAMHENLVVVGDDAQSIYSFRGANIQNILNFQRDYPDLQVFKLEQNYRSTVVIVSAANEVIAHNEEQLPKTVYTANEAGDAIRVVNASDEQDEAQRIVDAIREQKAMFSYHNRDFGILYRTNAQSRAIEDGLRRAGLSYKIFGGQSFYARKEIKDVLAYAKLVINPTDEESLLRVLNYPTRGIGKKSQEGIQIAAQEKQVNVWSVVSRAQEFAHILGRGAKAIADFAHMIRSFKRTAESKSAAEAIEYIAKHSGILKDLHAENSTESLSRWENVQELINAAAEFTDRQESTEQDASLSTFLLEVSLLTDADNDPEDDNYISLMTIHAAKGLEFKSVVVAGLEENLFPSYMSLAERSALEEERRLFYVAITRAEKRLMLTHADSRLRFGERQAFDPSRFLEEIPEKYVYRPRARANRAPTAGSGYEVRRKTGGAFGNGTTGRGNSAASGSGNQLASTGTGQHRPPTPQPRQPRNLTPVGKTDARRPASPKVDLEGLAEGVQVEHPKFGVGTVKRLTEDRMVVDFPLKANTTLLLKFAKVRVVK